MNHSWPGNMGSVE